MATPFRTAVAKTGLDGHSSTKVGHADLHWDADVDGVFKFRFLLENLTNSATFLQVWVEVQASNAAYIGTPVWIATQKVVDTATTAIMETEGVTLVAGQIAKFYVASSNASDTSINATVTPVDCFYVEAMGDAGIALMKTGLAGLVVSATGANTSDHADAEPDGGVVTTGTNTAGNSDSTWAAGTYWQIAAVATPVNGYTLNVSQLFTLGVTKRANTVRIVAKESFSGSGDATGVHVWAWSYRTSAYERLSFVGSGSGGWISGSGDAVYTYTLSVDHQEQGTGVVSLRYTTTNTNTAQYLYLDQVLVNAVVVGSGNPTVAEIAAGVKNIDILENLGEGTLAYALMQQINMRTSVAAGDTATSFTLTAGYAVADAYVGCAIQVEQESTETYCTRQIVGYTDARVVTLDAALPFTPAPGDGVYILAGGYSRVTADASGRVTVGSNADKTGYSGTATNMVSLTGIATAQNVTDATAPLAASLTKIQAAVYDPLTGTTEAGVDTIELSNGAIVETSATGRTVTEATP